MGKIHVSTYAVGLVLLYSATSPAMAQDAAAQQQAEIDTTGVQTDAESQSADTSSVIVVTAQKREQSLADVPVSISAVTGAELSEKGITQIADLQKVVPGLVAAETYMGSPVYYLRGVGFYDTSLAARPSVAMYEDEAPIAFAAMAMGRNFDLERVEVLKGPQGTLFGTNSTGGAINFIAAKPTDTFEGGAGISYGRFNQVVADGFVSGPLTENLSARAAVQYERMDDWQYGYTNDRTNGSRDNLSGRLSLRGEFENVEANLVFTGTRNKSDMQAPQLVGKDLALSLIQQEFLDYPLAPDNARAADFSASFPNGKNSLQRDDWSWQAIGRIDVEVDPALTLTSLTSYAEASQEHAFDADGTTLALTDLYISGDLRSFSQELRASGEMGDSVSFIFGGNYENSSVSEFDNYLIQDSRNAFIFGSLGLPPTDFVPQIADQDIESYAAFANVDVEILPQVMLHGGVRYTSSTTDFAGCALAAGNLTYATGIATFLGVGPVPAGECATFTQQPDGSFEPGLVLDSLNENNVAWRAVLDWKPTDSTLLYVSASRGFKSGAFSNISSVFADQYTPVPQEELTAYEVGVKTAFFDNAVRLNAAAFHYDYLNKQLIGTRVVPVFGTLTALVSIPESTVQGAEFDLTIEPIQGLNLRAAATYVDSEVKGDFISNTAFGPLANFNGASFPNTPNWQANGGFQYDFALSGDLDAYFGADATYRGKSNSDFIPDPRLAIDSYFLVDARIGIRSASGKWRAQLWGRNLTNEVYATTVVRRNEALVRTTGMPVTYGVSFGYDF
ncbi:TonB-dependent receptor [Pelagerythrobacter sp.]|uniref:TonB-dependent receptor n=1 Tax=Pelagerythrobacter sp. TaxID=2800702 RepID=UPI0035AECC7F